MKKFLEWIVSAVLSQEYIPNLATILRSYNLCDPQIWWYFINPPNMPTEKKIRKKIIFPIPIYVHSGLPWVNHSFIIERFPYIDIFVFVTCHSLWMWAPEKTEAFLRGKLFWKLSERAETFLKTLWEGRNWEWISSLTLKLYLLPPLWS